MIFIIAIIILSLTFLLLLVFLSKHLNGSYWESRNVPYYRPQSYMKSIVSMYLKEESILHKMKFVYKKHKNSPYVGIMILNKPVLMVTSPELAKTILLRDFDCFNNRTSSIQESIDPLTYHSLFFAKDDLWKSLKLKISPIFSPTKVKHIFPLQKSCVDNLVNYFSDREGSIIEIEKVVKRFVVDLITSCALGIDAKSLSEEDSEVLKMSHRLLDVNSLKRNISLLSYLLFPQIANFFKLTCVDDKAMNYFNTWFLKNQRKRKEMGFSRPDLIEVMNNLKLKDNDCILDDLTMASQAIMFLVAGQDTTAATISFLLYEIAMNPQIQEQIRESVSKDITYESLQEMKYLDMVIQETLRKYPIGAFIIRETSQKYTVQETGLILDKNISVILNSDNFHSDPDYFPDPQKFDPERFNKDNIQAIESFTFLPFGEGPRMCKGKLFATIVIKLAVAALIKNFQFEKSSLTQDPLKINPSSVVVESNDGIYLKITKI